MLAGIDLPGKRAHTGTPIWALKYASLFPQYGCGRLFS